MIEDSIPTMRKNRHFSMRISIIFLLIIAIFRKTDAYEPPLVSHSLDRRTLLRLTVASSFAVSSAAVSPPAHASQYCTMGVGDDCENLAEGNELIKSLQARSAANREVYAQVCFLKGLTVRAPRERESYGCRIDGLVPFLTRCNIYLIIRTHIMSCLLYHGHHLMLSVSGSSQCLLHEELSRFLRFPWQNTREEVRR